MFTYFQFTLLYDKKSLLYNEYSHGVQHMKITIVQSNKKEDISVTEKNMRH